MTRSTETRIYRRNVKRGMIDEIKRRTGRDATTSAEVRDMIRERIEKKEREKAGYSVDIPEQE